MCPMCRLRHVYPDRHWQPLTIVSIGARARPREYTKCIVLRAQTKIVRCLCGRTRRPKRWSNDSQTSDGHMLLSFRPQPNPPTLQPLKKGDCALELGAFASVQLGVDRCGNSRSRWVFIGTGCVQPVVLSGRMVGAQVVEAIC